MVFIRSSRIFISEFRIFIKLYYQFCVRNPNPTFFFPRNGPNTSISEMRPPAPQSSLRNPTCGSSANLERGPYVQVLEKGVISEISHFPADWGRTKVATDMGTEIT